MVLMRRPWLLYELMPEAEAKAFPLVTSILQK